MARVGCYMFLFFMALAVSEAIECYHCATAKDGKGCGEDKFDKYSKKKNCTIWGTCVKTKTCYDSIERGCGLTSNVGCVEEKGAETCTCKDLCNEATVQVVSMVTLAFVVFTNIAFRCM